MFDMANMPTCILIMNILRNHLLKARTEEDGTLLGFDEMDERMFKDYKAKQTNLNELGVTEACLVAIATHRAGIEGNLADEALELLIALSQAGHKAVQTTLADYIRNIDRDGRVWNHMKGRQV